MANSGRIYPLDFIANLFWLVSFSKFAYFLFRFAEKLCCFQFLGKNNLRKKILAQWFISREPFKFSET